jgi:hypothetical protein
MISASRHTAGPCRVRSPNRSRERPRPGWHQVSHRAYAAPRDRLCVDLTAVVSQAIEAHPTSRASAAMQGHRATLAAAAGSGPGQSRVLPPAAVPAAAWGSPRREAAPAATVAAAFFRGARPRPFASGCDPSRSISLSTSRTIVAACPASVYRGPCRLCLSSPRPGDHRALGSAIDASAHPDRATSHRRRRRRESVRGGLRQAHHAKGTGLLLPVPSLAIHLSPRCRF